MVYVKYQEHEVIRQLWQTGAFAVLSVSKLWGCVQPEVAECSRWKCLCACKVEPGEMPSSHEFAALLQQTSCRNLKRKIAVVRSKLYFKVARCVKLPLVMPYSIWECQVQVQTLLAIHFSTNVHLERNRLMV